MHSYKTSELLLAGDSNRPNVDEVLKVTDIDVSQEYKDWSEEEKELVSDFIAVQLKYGRVCCPKERVYKLWKESQLNAYKNNVEDEAKGDFSCLLCFLTCEDAAFALWTLDNSAADWERKSQSPDDLKLKYSCGTKYTADRKSRRTEGEESITKEGMEIYHKLVSWVDALKSSPAYDDIRMMCNVTAKTMNVLPQMKESSKNKFKRRLEAEVDEGIEPKKVRIRKGSMVPGMDEEFRGLVVAI